MRPKINMMIVLTMCALAALAGVAWATYEADRDDGAEAVLKAFNQSGARFERFQVNGWATDTPVASEEQAEGYFKSRLKKIFGNKNLPAIVKTNRHGYLVLKANGSVGSGIGAVATLQVKTREIQNQTPFLILSLSTKNPNISYRKMNRILHTFVNSSDDHKSTVISGVMTGIITEEQANQIMEKMLRVNKANQVGIMKTGSITSETAYSPAISKQLTYGEKSVNINMALRYNFVEKNTLLYVGSPIITSEY